MKNGEEGAGSGRPSPGASRREFKFRAWHGASKRMISWDLLLVLMRGDQVWIPAKVPPTLAMTPDSEYVRQWTLRGNPFQIATLDMLQWTGLQDKNGRDIYEGDILKSLAGIGMVVRFIDGEFEAVFGQIRIDRDSWCMREIVGNIYETPHLLEARSAPNPSSGEGSSPTHPHPREGRP